MQNFRNNVSFYNRESSCGCDRQTDRSQKPDRMMDRRDYFSEMLCKNTFSLENMPLAMAYVPWQKWQNIFEADKGFHCGTIFQELHKPFEHAGGGCR